MLKRITSGYGVSEMSSSKDLGWAWEDQAEAAGL